MKKLLTTLLAMLPLLVFAQVKPSIPKAEKALRDNKIDEAKTIIDATTGSQEFMVDKKGQPTKNAAKAWFLRGIIYSAMDTTKNEAFMKLSPNAFEEAKTAFEKSAALDSKTPNWFNNAQGFPLLNEQVKQTIGNIYFNKAINAYNDEQDYKKALEMAERTLYYSEPIGTKDTLLLFYTSAFALSADNPAKAISYIEKYLAQGGTNPQAYASIANTYIEQKDHENAIKWLKAGQQKFPAYRDLRLLELNIYLNDKKYDVAKEMVEKELQGDPNRDNYFLYGQLNRELGDNEKAKGAFKKALELDPKYFDAASELANCYWKDAKKYKDEIGALGNSKEDLKKKQALDAPYVAALKAYLPYIEAAEKLAPDDVSILYSLLNAYTELDDQANAAKVKKKLKSLGEDI